MYGWFAYMYAYVPSMFCAHGDQWGHWIPWNWGYNSYELPCECWKSIQGPLDKQLLLLTTFQPLFFQYM